MTLVQLPIPPKPNLNPHPNTGAILNQGILTEGEGGGVSMVDLLVPTSSDFR